MLCVRYLGRTWENSKQDQQKLINIDHDDPVTMYHFHMITRIHVQWHHDNIWPGSEICPFATEIIKKKQKKFQHD